MRIVGRAVRRPYPARLARRCARPDRCEGRGAGDPRRLVDGRMADAAHRIRSDEHTSELPSLMRISYTVFCLEKNNFTGASANIGKDIMEGSYKDAFVAHPR